MKIFFTLHAEHRMKARGIQKEDVIEAISQPENFSKRGRKRYYQRTSGFRRLEVVCEEVTDCLKVITVYWV